MIKFEIRNSKFEANSKFLLRPPLKSSRGLGPISTGLSEGVRKCACHRTGSKRHRTAALQDAVATGCQPLYPRGLGVRQAHAAFVTASANSASIGDHVTGSGTSILGFVSNIGFRISSFSSP